MSPKLGFLKIQFIIIDSFWRELSFLRDILRQV